MCFTIGILSLLQWTVDGRLRIGFFTLRFIPAGDELTFDYQFQRFGLVHRVCVSLSVCVHVCLTDMHTHRHTDTEQTQTHTYIHTLSTCLCVSVYMYASARLCVCVHTNVHAKVHMFV